MNIRVLSNNILVKNPFYKKDKTVIKLDGKVQEELLMAEISKAKRLLVAFAGEACTRIKEKDEVYIDTDRLMSSPRVVIEDEDFFIMREVDVIFVYKGISPSNILIPDASRSV